MSIDKSLRRKNSLARARSVLTRDERIKTLMETDRWLEGRSPFGLPKVRVVKIVTKKGKPKEKAEEATPTAEGAAPAAEGAAPSAKAAKPEAKAAKPEGKAAGKK
jgi:small basic protein (TIGR04137 family)